MAIPSIPDWGATTYFTALQDEEEKYRQRRLKNAEAFNKYVESNVASGTKLGASDLRRYINMISGDDAMFDASYPDSVLAGLAEDQTRRAGSVLDEQAFAGLKQKAEVANLVKGFAGTLVGSDPTTYEKQFVTAFGDRGKALWEQMQPQMGALVAEQRRSQLDKVLGQDWVNKADDVGVVDERMAGSPAWMIKAVKERIELNNYNKQVEIVAAAKSKASESRLDWTLYNDEDLRREAAIILESVPGASRYNNERTLSEIYKFIKARQRTLQSGKNIAQEKEDKAALAGVFGKVDQISPKDVEGMDEAAIRSRATTLLQSQGVETTEVNINQVSARIRALGKTQKVLEGKGEATEQASRREQFYAYLNDPKSLYKQAVARNATASEIVAAANEDGKQFGVVFQNLQEIEDLLGQRADLDARSAYHAKQAQRKLGASQAIRQAVEREFGTMSKQGFKQGDYQKHMLSMKDGLELNGSKNLLIELMQSHYVRPEDRGVFEIRLNELAKRQKIDTQEGYNEVRQILIGEFNLQSLSHAQAHMMNGLLRSHNLTDIPYNADFTEWQAREVKDLYTSFKDTFAKDINSIERIVPGETTEARTDQIKAQVEAKKNQYLAQLDRMEKLYREDMRDHVLAFRKGTGEASATEAWMEGSVLYTIERMRKIVRQVGPTHVVPVRDMTRPDPPANQGDDREQINIGPQAESSTSQASDLLIPGGGDATGTGDNNDGAPPLEDPREEFTKQTTAWNEAMTGLGVEDRKAILVIRQHATNPKALKEMWEDNQHRGGTLFVADKIDGGEVALSLDEVLELARILRRLKKAETVLRLTPRGN